MPEIKLSTSSDLRVMWTNSEETSLQLMGNNINGYFNNNTNTSN